MPESFKIDFDKITLAGLAWKIENPKAVMCLIHGLGEHCNRYNHVAERMNEVGISVYGIDLPGHGSTTGKRGHSNETQLLETVRKLSNIAFEDGKDKPAFLYGHSMGGNIALRYLLTKNHGFKAAIITSPWIELTKKPPSIKFALAKLMHKIYPRFTDRTRLDADFISRVIEEVDKYKNDPLVHDYITTELFFTIVNNGQWILYDAPKIKIPVLLMHGTADQLTSPESCTEFAEKNPDMVKLKLWKNGYHELHNDEIKQEVLTFATDWISRQI